jgi:phosphatidylethanolamine-binding protein (PEBP) family uncharacterized protein
MLMSSPAAATLLLATTLGTTAACGGDDTSSTVDAAAGGDGAVAIDGAPTDGAGGDAPVTTITLTSTAFIEGGVIPMMYSCRGTNVSPPLAWTDGTAAQGYAVVLTDLSNGLIHSIIWDVSTANLSLPENVAKVAEPAVPAGSKQPLAYDNQTRGYLGPCPGSTHTYQFSIHGVDSYPLPGVTLGSTRGEVRAAITAHEVVADTLTATFTP